MREGWFRWYRGSVSDIKFEVVARRSGQSLPVVIAMWAALLEYASETYETDPMCNAHVTHCNEDDEICNIENDIQGVRGSIKGFDCEGMDIRFRLEDGATQKILDALESKGMISEASITNWVKRQPKREDPSTTRVREHRERKRNEQKKAECNAKKRDETHCNADVTQGNAPEKEKEREKEIINTREESVNYTDSSCPELCETAPRQPSEIQIQEPPVLVIPLVTLKDKKTKEPEVYPVFQKDIDDWQEAYPGVNVMQLVREIRQWNISNLAKRKTKSGIRNHITNWLKREQNKGVAGQQRGRDRPTQQQSGRVPFSRIAELKDSLTPEEQKLAEAFYTGKASYQDLEHAGILREGF